MNQKILIKNLKTCIQITKFYTKNTVGLIENWILLKRKIVKCFPNNLGQTLSYKGTLKNKSFLKLSITTNIITLANLICFNRTKKGLIEKVFLIKQKFQSLSINPGNLHLRISQKVILIQGLNHLLLKTTKNSSSTFIVMSNSYFKIQLVNTS